jgi:hypothetical protein
VAVYAGQKQSFHPHLAVFVLHGKQNSEVACKMILNVNKTVLNVRQQFFFSCCFLEKYCQIAIMNSWGHLQGQRYYTLFSRPQFITNLKKRERSALPNSDAKEI